MLKRNKDVREAKGSVPAWVIAEKLSIHEKTFYGWLRFEMSDDKKKTVFKAINEAKKELEVKS